MNHEKRMKDYAQELVSRYSKYLATDEFTTLELSDVPQDEQEDFCRYYIEAKDRDLDLIVEGVRNADFKIDSDYNCALLAMLKNNSEENRQQFAHTVISNVLRYCADELQEVLNEACADYDAAMEEENR